MLTDAVADVRGRDVDERRFNDVLAEVFLGLPVMREFLRRFEVRPQPARQNVMHALEAAYRSLRRV